MISRAPISCGHDRRILRVVFLAGLVLVGCARLKQCAYQGVHRDEWQQPDKVIAALRIQAGAVIADLGAGGGYFTFKLAEAVGERGKVYAVDIDPDMVDLIAGEAKQRDVVNIKAIVASLVDPHLPEQGVDLVFSSNTYHHIDNRVAYFANLRTYLRANGRIAIIEYDQRNWIVGLLGHYTPSETIKREMGQAGYVLRREFDFLDRQSFLIFAPD